MPKQGWKTVTIKSDLYDLLEERAEHQQISVASEIENLVELSGQIKVTNEEREILRSTFYQMAIELKSSNPEASVHKIRDWLKDLLDVSV